MRKHHLLLSIVVTMITISGLLTRGSVSNSPSDVILRNHDSDLTNGEILNLADFCSRNQKAVIVSRNTYSIRNIPLVHYENSLDLRSGEHTVKSGSTESLTMYNYKYVVILPNDTIREREFYLNSSDSTQLNLAIRAEVAALKNAVWSVSKKLALAQIIGDSGGIVAHYSWHRFVTYYVTGWERDGDYTVEVSAWRDIYKCELDISGNRYWESEWRLLSSVDPDDYEESYTLGVGPYVTVRGMDYDEDNLVLNKYGPTGTVHTYSYGWNTQIQIGPSGPVYQVGLSQSSGHSDVETWDWTSAANSHCTWNEVFSEPDYSIWPYMIPPPNVAHSTYTSYQGAEFFGGSGASMSGTQLYVVEFRKDYNFRIVNFFWLQWDSSYIQPYFEDDIPPYSS